MKGSVSRLVNAVDFAANKHQFQKRKNANATPYINHPIGVSKILTDAGVNNEDVIIAALLHDTVEDTGTSLEEIKENFGPEVMRIVSECTDDKSLPKDQRKRLQVEHAKTISPEAKLVKLADKIHNCESLLKDAPASWSPSVIQGYFVWAFAVFEEIRGMNHLLDSRFERLRDAYFETLTGKVPCVPLNTNLVTFLENYYREMSLN